MSGIKIRGTLIYKDGMESDGVVEIENGVIAGAHPYSKSDGRVDYDFSGQYIGPGFVDVHIHGANGADFVCGDGSAFKRILAYCAAHGTTSVLAALPASPANAIDAALAAIGCFMCEYEKEPLGCAAILGVHLEGPFINRDMPGAMDVDCILPPSLEQYRHWEKTGSLKMITLAPEVPGAREIIQYASRVPGMIVSAGHTKASYEEIVGAAGWGLNHLTHFYNAMTGLGHREPGAAGAGLFCPELTLELITDFIHVHPRMVALAWRIKGADSICLVTDSVELAGLPNGRYADKKGAVKTMLDGKITTAGGTLAGSAHTLNRAVRNMTRCGAPIWEAWRMASYQPARKLKMEHIIGALKPGLRADLAVLDKDFLCTAAFIDGRKV